MNVLLLFITGISLAFLGALPLGTVNLAIINNSIQKKRNAVIKIATAASMSEVLIAWFAYVYGQLIFNIITTNPFLQYGMIVVLLMLSGYFFFKKNTSSNKEVLKISAFVKGIFLGLANPSVWIYWILVITFLKNYTSSISGIQLILFLIAVYLGKLFALTFYGKVGQKLAHKESSSKNIIIGSLLLLTATVQLISQII